MKNQSGSYLEKPYLINSSSLATFVICSALLSPSGLSSIEDGVSLDHNKNNYGYSLKQSLGNVKHSAYLVPTPTWSHVDNFVKLEIDQSADQKIDVTESLKVIKNLAFLTVDEEVDNEIERYFASMPIKTKTIMINPRIKQG